jgi:hypothetical protein
MLYSKDGASGTSIIQLARHACVVSFYIFVFEYIQLLVLLPNYSVGRKLEAPDFSRTLLFRLFDILNYVDKNLLGI